MPNSRKFLITGAAMLTLVIANCSGQNPADPSVISSDELSTGVTSIGGQAQIPGQYIIVLNRTVPDVPAAAADIARIHGLAIGYQYRNSILGFSATVPEGRLRQLAQDDRIAYIEPDRIVTVGPFESNGNGKGKGGNGGKPGGDTPDPQVVPWGVTRVGGSSDGSGKVAWVIDTGIDLNHADMAVDVARSANFVRRGKDSPSDGNGHGTHVAGTIAAIDNDRDVVGVAAGASVVAVRVLDNSGSGTYSAVIAGVDYVAAQATSGDVANMSLTGPGSQALDDAVLAAAQSGIRFSLAAGNYSAFSGDYSPARVNHANIFTVSAYDNEDVFASFSNYGNPPVDYAAPGVNILSTKKGGGTTAFNGTSMAAPHVAGLLLLGAVSSDGSVFGDPDGQADPIAYRGG